MDHKYISRLWICLHSFHECMNTPFCQYSHKFSSLLFACFWLSLLLPFINDLLTEVRYNLSVVYFSLISNDVEYFLFICHLYLIFEELSVYFFRLFIELISWCLVNILYTYIYIYYLDFM